MKTKNSKMTEPYTGPFPRKRHSHCCITCLERRGQGAVSCYKKQCTKPIRTESCESCRVLTPTATYQCVSDQELAEEFAQLSPEDKAIVSALPTYDDDDKGRTRIGNTPTCEDCDEPQDHCICGDDEGDVCPVCGCLPCSCDGVPCEQCGEIDCECEPEAEAQGGLFPQAPETKQSSFKEQLDRLELDQVKARRTELRKNPALIQAALPGFLDLLRRFDECMRADNVAGAMLIHEEADKYAADLQGGNPFGMLCLDGAAHLLDKAAAAPDGEIPMWGQRGNFVLQVGLTLIRFEVDGIFGCMDPFHFSINAVNWDKPFPSETGYRSFFAGVAHVPVGCTVADWVTHAVKEYIADDKALSKKLPMIDFTTRDRHRDDPENKLPVANAPHASAAAFTSKVKTLVGRREIAPPPPPPPALGQLSLFGGAL